MSFPTYGRMKDSGVEWLGDVPEHWKVKRLRFVADLNPSKGEIATKEKTDEVSFIPMEAIDDNGNLTLDRLRKISDVETGYTYFQDGDVTIAKITPCFENGKGAVMRSLHGGIGFGTTELIVVRPKQHEASSEYLDWLFRSAPFRQLGEGEMYGAGGQKRVPDSFVRNFEIAFPPLPEQTTIAAFLDRETGKIDALVEEQKRLIELLQEKRQAVISHAVTKGLDPKVLMKPSGVEWLGDVPEHWEVKRLRFLCLVETGSRDTAHAVDEGAFPFFVRSQTVERIDGYSQDCEAVLTAGDGVGVGKVFHYINGKFDFHQRVYMFHKFKELDGRFFFHFLRVNFARVALEGGAKSTVDSLRMPLILNFILTVPPSAEQLKIIAFVEALEASFNQLISEAQSAITLLQERRSALISAAVTGKIDVRGLVPAEAQSEAA